ncbi:methyltransferase [Campylobacter sp.]|uniref:tRNA1(Val) (adenine(37)-N6)-methyltransferase n=1 Tax=Campylobacter sp. TaxID=205 RepID=UPI0026DCECD0|nr:methyltransferase [Campylobacter sp.]MDO4673781.1 methyltransferase [Campylobacter sp.]
MHSKTIKFFQLKNAYRYNSDSLLLADFALNFGVKNELLDVGAGCGIVGILLKCFHPELSLSLLDIQTQNIALIERNLQENALKAELFCCDFKDFISVKKFDHIISNPPFHRQNAQKSPNLHKNMSKSGSFLPLQNFIAKADSLLAPRGVLYLCYSAQALGELCAILEKHKLKLTKIRFVHSKKEAAARLLLAQIKKSSQSACEVLPPLFVYDGGGLSEEMGRIGARFKGIESRDIDA